MSFVRLRDVHVRYPILMAGRAQSLFRSVARSASFGALGRTDSNDIAFVHALRGITLDLREGDRVGLIGRNGAGKSTLLRAIAGVSWPQAGTREVQGRITCMLNVNAGVDLEKTGYANIDFVSRLFGLDKAQRAAVLEDVITFTDLGDYLAIPVRTYSSGMMVRLSFALATALPGDIFVIDEVIGAGDAFFMERARARAANFYTKAKVMIMASHADGVLKDFCTHGLWLDQGRVVDYGPIDEVLDRYNAQQARFPEGTVPSFSQVRPTALAGETVS